MKRYIILVALVFFSLFTTFSLSYGQPDLTVPGKIRTTGPPSFVGENIKVPLAFKIENKGNMAAGPFQLSLMQRLPAPPGAEQEIEFTGPRTFSGLEPRRRIDISGDVTIHKSFAGKKVQIRAIVDSGMQVRESKEDNNWSPWLEVQMPVRVERPPLTPVR